MDYYNALLADKEGTKVEQKIQKNGKIQTVSGTGEVTVTEVLLLNEAGQAVEAIEVGQNVVLQVTTTVHKPVSRLVLGYGIKDRLGQVMYGTNTHHTQQILENLEAGKQCVFNIKFPANLGPGTYSVQLALTGGVTHLEQNYEWRDLALIFDVVNTSRILFAGSAWIEPEIEVVV